MLNQVIDLTGQRFGRLRVTSRANVPSRKTFWNCECSCGNIKIVRSDCLRRGQVTSCGCLKKEQDRINLTAAHKHKMAGTRLYRKWQDMKNRCYNSRVHRYERYGGRGIQVCKQWRDSFEPFRDWALANGYAGDLGLDRIDNDGNYEPSNCRWVKAKVQNNNRSTTHLIAFGGKTQSIMQWAEELGLNYGTLKSRIRRGMPLERALVPS